MSRLRGIRDKLNQMRMPELRNVLVDLNLARSGRKVELVERIAMTLETFEAKAAENSSNHATAAFYTDQLSAGLRSIDTQTRLSRPQMHAGAHASVHTPPSHGNTMSHPMMPTHFPPVLPPPATHRSIPSYHTAVHMHYHSQPPQSQHRVGAPMGISPLTNGRAGTSSAAGLKAPARSLGADGSMTLIPSTLPGTSGARCYCQHDAPSAGAIVHCVLCRKTFHAKCHQIPASTPEWYCETCRADIYDPFYVVRKRVVPGIAVQFMRSPSVFRFSYSVTDRDINDMYSRRDAKAGAMTPGSLELQLRCFQLKDDLATGTCWPTATQLSVNGFNVPITQRAPPGQANPSKVLRELPANVFPFTRVGSNKVEVRTNEHPGVFVLMVHMVEVRALDELVREVKLASENITYEHAKQDVIKSFGDEDEDDVVALSTILSVRCPLGLCVISLPARGLHCKHLQCFDLRTFLQFSKKARSKAYRCTVCHNFIKASDLRIDPYLKKLLADVAHDDELEEVEILPDASWRRRITDDSPAPPDAKRVKTEHVETAAPTPAPDASALNGVNESDTSAAASRSAETGSHASGPVEIDLSLTSDEEEEDGDAASALPALTTSSTTAAVAAAPPPPTTAANGGSSGLLLDNEVSVLTVDSDVWDTTRSTTSGEMRLANALSAAEGMGNSANGDMFPFPLDESIFAGLAPPSSTSAASSAGLAQSAGAGHWNPMYSMPYIGSSTVPALGQANAQPYASASNASWSPPVSSAGLPQSEVDLASTMAMLSQDTSPQPDRRPPPQHARSSSMNDPLDIICLLDSDSE